MPKYHFHLDECGSRTLDDDGSEHCDLDAAHAFAIVSAREIMCEELKSGQLCLSCHIDISDEDGQHLIRVNFSDAVRVSGLSPA